MFPPSVTGIPKFPGSIGKPPPRETLTDSGPTAKPKPALSRIEEKTSPIQNANCEPTSGSSRIEEKSIQIQNVICDETVLQAIQDRWEVAIALKEAIEEYREYIEIKVEPRISRVLKDIQLILYHR